MQIKRYRGLCEDAIIVRKKVFVQEQGFCDEFDEIDKTAFHLVAYDGERPIAVCRFFNDAQSDIFLIGRLAVLKDYRAQHLGAQILKEAETAVKSLGGKAVKLHSQEQALGFYEKQGYKICSEMEYEEHCPHYWMKKNL